MATVGRLLADDVVWHSPGKNALTGDYTGIPAVLALFGRTFELTGGTFCTEVHDNVANDAHGVALVTISGSRDGTSNGAIGPCGALPRRQASRVVDVRGRPGRGRSAVPVTPDPPMSRG